MYDLNMRLKSTREKDTKLAVKRLYELGWDCVAWTTLANGKVSGNQIKPMKSVALEPIQKRDALELRSLVNSRSAEADIRQISRITVTVDDVIDAQTLTSGNAILNNFDIVAVRPGNLRVMAYLCKTAEIDIISLDFTRRLPFATNKKLLDEAVKRGIHFEIIYSPLIGTASGPRQEVFSNTRVLIQYLRGRNILLSSGADSIGQIRGPMDVNNIGKALGLNNEQATNALSNNCAMVLKHAAARKCRFLPLEIISRMDFASRFPEINLDDSQSNFKIADTGLSGSLNSDGDSLAKFGLGDDEADENDDDQDDDIGAGQLVATSSQDAHITEELALDLPSTDIDRDDDQDGLSICDHDEIDAAENNDDDGSSFAQGDSFISFSDTPSSSSSNKRSYVDTCTSEEGIANRTKLEAISIPLINSNKSVRLKKFKKIKVAKHTGLKKKI